MSLQDGRLSNLVDPLPVILHFYQRFPRFFAQLDALKALFFVQLILKNSANVELKLSGIFLLRVIAKNFIHNDLAFHLVFLGDPFHEFGNLSLFERFL